MEKQELKSACKKQNPYTLEEATYKNWLPDCHPAWELTRNKLREKTEASKTMTRWIQRKLRAAKETITWKIERNCEDKSRKGSGIAVLRVSYPRSGYNTKDILWKYERKNVQKQQLKAKYCEQTLGPNSGCKPRYLPTAKLQKRLWNWWGWNKNRGERQWRDKKGKSVSQSVNLYFA